MGLPDLSSLKDLPAAIEELREGGKTMVEMKETMDQMNVSLRRINRILELQYEQEHGVLPY